jgi:hypothetical protein
MDRALLGRAFGQSMRDAALANNLSIRRRLPGIAGLGDDTTTITFPWDTTGTYSGGGTGTGLPATTSSGSSSLDWTPIIQQATQGLIDIAKLNSIQSGTSQTGDTTIRQTTGYPVNALTTGYPGSATVGVQADKGGMLAIAAAVAVGLYLISQKR